MPPRRLLFIANPAAGCRSALATIEDTRPFFRGVEIEVRRTERPQHAFELARDARGIDGIVAVGGDGTLHEVVNGWAARPPGDRPAIGVLPAGSGNSLALDLEAADPSVAAARIARGDTRQIDLARVDVDGRTVHSINVIAWGAAARINLRAERLRWSRGSRYTLSAVLELARPRIAGARATLDGVRQDGALLGVALVTRYSGRGMLLAPEAELDDGLLDLVTIRRAGRLRLARLLRAVFDGSHVGSPLVESRRVPGFTLELDPGSSVVIDGESISASHLEVRVIERAVPVFA